MQTSATSSVAGFLDGSFLFQGIHQVFSFRTAEVLNSLKPAAIQEWRWMQRPQELLECVIKVNPQIKC
jgi:hypothetical protein